MGRRGHHNNRGVLIGCAVVSLMFLAAEASERALNMAISPDLPPVSKKNFESEEDASNVGKIIPETDNKLRRVVTGFEPDQVHLTYWGAPSKMLVSFASSNGLVVMGRPAPPPNATAEPVAQWGVSATALATNASCVTVTYVQDQYAYRKSPGYVSPYLSHCLMTGLPAGTAVFYRVGWPDYGEWSPVFNFTTFKQSGNFPLRVGVMADLGLSYNASATVSEVTKDAPQVVLNIGDLPYADNYLPTGREGTLKGLKYLLSYQPRWDMYARMLQPLAAHVPIMTSTGNHEVEFQPDGTVFAAYTARYPVPQGGPDAPPSVKLNRFSEADPSPAHGLYYSWDVPGAAHFVALTSYITNDTFSPDTEQYKWFEADLKKVNRSATPWLIAYFHAPMYSSYEASFKQVECMRLTYEPLLFKYGVDLVLNGHVHAYERFKPAYNYSLNPCGTVHITVGCGGKPGEPGSGLQALDHKYIEAGSFYCKDPSVLDVKPNIVQPRRCHTYQPKLGGFCWNRQPDFSAYREPAYGSALLTLLNATHAEWRWNRNDNAAPRDDDRVMLDRSAPKACANLNGRRRAALR